MHSATNLFYRSLSVRQQSVCTLPVAHTVVATTWVRNLQKSSAQVHLELSHQELLVHHDAFHQLLNGEAHSSEEAARFPVAGFSINSWWGNCVESKFLSVGGPRNTISSCGESYVSHLNFSGSRSSRHLFLFDTICGPVHADNSSRSLMIIWTTFQRASLHKFWMVSKKITTQRIVFVVLQGHGA